MKYYYTLIFLLLISSSISAQKDSSHLHHTTDTTPSYVRLGTLPTFSIRQPDSSWFSRSQLKEGKPVLILYFSPDCGHCMLETEDMISKMKSLKNLQVVMVTSREFDEMKNYADHYKLHRFSNVKIGRDAQRTISKYYEVKFTPFSALYSKNGKLLKSYKKGIDWPELISQLK